MAEDNSKKRLGRGLAALIGEMDQPVDTSPRQSETISDTSVPIEHIRTNRNNPRRFFSDSELSELADSIREHGVVQPVLVRPIHGEDLAGARYEIIAGERRWRASQKAGLHQIPIVIRDVADQQALELAIIENVQRSDLNPIEEAQGYNQLIEEYDYSQADLGKVIGKSRSHVANTMRLLKLPTDVQNMVTEGTISSGHARALITTDDPMAIASKIVRDGLSVRQVEELIQSGGDGQIETRSATGPAAAKDPDVLAMEKRLEEALGLKVGLGYKPNGSGDLKIKFSNLEQLDEICRRLVGG